MMLRYLYNNTLDYTTIYLVLIDPQSVEKRTHDLMDTVNAKKRDGRPFAGVSINI
jgi:hypothetical protein